MSSRFVHGHSDRKGDTPPHTFYVDRSRHHLPISRAEIRPKYLPTLHGKRVYIKKKMYTLIGWMFRFGYLTVVVTAFHQTQQTSGFFQRHVPPKRADDDHSSSTTTTTRLLARSNGFDVDGGGFPHDEGKPRPSKADLYSDEELENLLNIHRSLNTDDTFANGDDKEREGDEGPVPFGLHDMVLQALDEI